MIRNQWYAVIESREVEHKPIGVIRMGEKLVFWRDQTNKVHCFVDKCVHRGAELSKGKLKDNKIQCPFHGLEYDVSGRVVLIPANGKATPVPNHFQIPKYVTHEGQNFIWIWWGSQPPEKLEPPGFFSDIHEELSYYSIKTRWTTHYSRVIENQLDLAHLPFVHHNTIGRGGRTIVDGPRIEWISDHEFHVHVHNRKDDGRRPLKAEELPIPDPASDVKLEFMFPNLWQLYISPKMRVLAAFVPIDMENTLMYLRFYQSIVRAPVFRDIFNRMFMLYNRIVVNQDKRVVRTQEPKVTGLRIDEMLFQADRPITEYRRRRQDLQGK